MAIARFATSGTHRGRVLCDLCGQPATDAHHLIIARGVVAKAHLGLQLFVEDPINLVFLCPECHTGKADSAEAHRDELIRKQYERFGYEAVCLWGMEFELRSRLSVDLPEPEG